MIANNKREFQWLADSKETQLPIPQYRNFWCGFGSKCSPTVISTSSHVGCSTSSVIKHQEFTHLFCFEPFVFFILTIKNGTQNYVYLRIGLDMSQNWAKRPETARPPMRLTRDTCHSRDLPFYYCILLLSAKFALKYSKPDSQFSYKKYNPL